jgi:predicted DNA-binding mobile mystery protein A
MNKREIVRKQLDNKLLQFERTVEVVPPASGWIYAIRYSLNMSLRQLGQRLSITPQSVKEIEEREKKGTISLKVLQQVATALNMKFVYGFIPKNRTIESMIEERAKELAEKIVRRTSIHMSLEDQEISDDRLNRAIEEKTKEFIDNLPRLLWD